MQIFGDHLAQEVEMEEARPENTQHDHKHRERTELLR